jgi:hypothetical protein
MRNEEWFGLGAEIAKKLKKSVRVCLPPPDSNESTYFEVVGGNAEDIEVLSLAKLLGTKVVVNVGAPGLKLKAIRA